MLVQSQDACIVNEFSSKLIYSKFINKKRCTNHLSFDPLQMHQNTNFLKILSMVYGLICSIIFFVQK